MKTNKLAYQVSVLSIVVNVLLAGLKLLAGIIGRSAAMLSDAVHTLSDVFSTVVVMVGMKMSEKEEDLDHPYGHEKIENIAGALLAVILAITALKIISDAGQNLFHSEQTPLQIPTWFALAAAVVSILSKEWMYQYTKKAAKTLSSPSLMADAWHHRSDALSSVGSLVGIGGAMLGFAVLDPIASIVIGVLILKAAYDIAKESLHSLTDTACSDEIIEEIRRLVLTEDGVVCVDDLKTRLFGAKFYVDLEISADENLSLKDAHDIASRVHDKVKTHFPSAKHCMVHINPICSNCPCKGS